jgi:hypothetical protein
MAITNATRLSDFAAGIGTEGAVLKIDNTTQRVGIGTQLPSQMLEVAGIVTATGFRGDGSLLEGITSAGLGTAIGDSNTVEEVIYYTDDLLTVTETTTVNPPASSSAAYTQYRDVKLDDSVDLIIETGDDFIPDVLGFGDDASDPNASGNGVFDEVYAGVIKNKNGLGAPAFANGLTSVGIGTFSSDVSIGGTLSVTGNVSVGGTLTYEDVKNVDSVGLITARTGIKVQSGGIDITTGNIDVDSGSIGIGENSPENNKLIIRGASTIGTNKGHIMLTGDSSVVGEGPQIVFSESGPGANWAGAYIGHTRQGGGSLGDLRFGTRAAAGDANTVPTERLRISNTGAFGIGGANYGTSGQVLTSGGASAAPQWATPSGGSWEVVSTHVLAGSDQYLDFNGWSNAYQKYQLVFSDVYYGHTDFNIYMRIYKDATSGNAGTLMTAQSYAANAVNCNVTSNGVSGGWTGWVDYHRLGNNNYGPLWHGTYDFYMGQPVSTPSGNNECSWTGSSMRERDISIADSCMYGQDNDKYLTGVRVFFFDQGSAISPTGGRFTLYRMKYS